MRSLAWKPKIPTNLQHLKDKLEETSRVPSSQIVKKNGRIDWYDRKNIDLLEDCILKQGLTYAETADKLGLNFNIIYNAARKWNIRSENKIGKIHYKELTSVELKVLIYLRSLRVSIVDCAEKLDLSPTTLSAIIKDKPSITTQANRKREKLIKEVMNDF